MKLTRLRLAQIRQFGGTLEIPTFAPGLNVFSGPNEAGKSTVVRAIRAAFFERYRSGVIDDLIPRGETPSTASPTVELGFELNGVAYALTKTFFAKRRCSLGGGPAPLDGEAAEEALARLLGFGFAGKGASKPEHWGIPGLLWIQQGEGHKLAAAVEHAADHLRTALESTLGAVASSAGDDVLARLRNKRDELLTPSGGRPKGAYADAIKAHTEAREQGAELDSRLAGYRANVDQLAGLRAQQQAEGRARPWEQHQARLRQAQADLAAAEQLQAQQQREQAAFTQLQQALLLMREQAASLERQRAQATQRQADIANTAAQLEAAQAAANTWIARKAQAERAQEDHAAQVARAEAAEHHRSLEDQRAAAQRDQQRLAAALAKAQAESDKLTALQASARANQIAAPAVAALQQQAEALRELEITRRAASTGLQLALQPGTAVTLDGQRVAPDSEHRLGTRAELQIAGVGRITVLPGTSDHGELSARVGQLRDELSAGLQGLGVASLDEALRRQALHQQALADAGTSAQLLKLSAPQGIEALRQSLASATAQQATLEAALQTARAAQPAAADADNKPAPSSLAEARAALAAAKAVAATAAQEHLAATTLQATAQARHAAAQAELQRLRAVLDDEQTRARERDAQAQLLQAQTRLDAAQAGLTQLQQQIERSRPDLLRQDVARWQASADQALQAHNARAGEIRALEGRLDAEGASGLDELRAELAVREQALARRQAELALRAQALDLLVSRLEAKRQAITRQLQAPLQARLDHHLRTLFPQGRMGLRDDLTPGELARGDQVVDFEQLSHGAQEQAALISRLACADLLKEAGKPTLIILDDALVHSDSARLEPMKRVLFDAATRHQVLLFTCHPERWDGVGVAARELRSFVAGAAR